MLVKRLDQSGQSGAALMMVVLATLLLGTACIAMLTAVGASTRNNTDALSESKAYYAAESGLQGTINILRNTPNLTYLGALSSQTAGTLGVTNVAVGDSSYSVVIRAPCR